MTAVATATLVSPPARRRRRLKLPLQQYRQTPPSALPCTPARESPWLSRRRPRSPSPPNSPPPAVLLGKPPRICLLRRDLRLVKNLRYIPRIAQACRFDVTNTPPPTTSTPSSEDPAVRFAPDVHIVEIPNRHCYSLQEKQDIWSRPREIRTNAQRNLTEFAYENHDARQAVELQDFVRTTSGGLVHPAHVLVSSDEDSEDPESDGSDSDDQV